jgi:hypothetical protein
MPGQGAEASESPLCGLASGLHGAPLALEGSIIDETPRAAHRRWAWVILCLCPGIHAGGLSRGGTLSADLMLTSGADGAARLTPHLLRVTPASPAVRATVGFAPVESVRREGALDFGSRIQRIGRVTSVVSAR